MDSFIKLLPTQDTIVEFNRKNDTFYNDQELNIQIGSHVGYLAFKGNTDGKYVKSAKLRLYLTKMSSVKNSRMGVYCLQDYEWEQDKLCWNNSPINEGELLDVVDFYYAAGVNCWYEADVSGAFADVCGGFNFTLRLDSETYLKDQHTVFASLESQTCAPELIIHYTDNAEKRVTKPQGENGYELWLRYRKCGVNYRMNYRKYFSYVNIPAVMPLSKAIAYELNLAIPKLFDITPIIDEQTETGLLFEEDLGLEKDGYHIVSTDKSIKIKGNGSGSLYGLYRLLSMVQREQNLSSLDIKEAPYFVRRVFNNWEDYDQTIERGYAGGGIWRWHELPDILSRRYIDYARVCASLSINRIIINNVNPDIGFIMDENMPRLKKLAELFRGYGIRLIINVSFDAPILLGGLTTANPTDSSVIAFWESLTDKIYKAVPDFCGYVIKGDSEGQPGPLKYGHTHAIGANMFARILQRYGGEVFWRAFVYRIPGLSQDRACQAYEFFKPLDGQFMDNVILQIKNGPMDFQVSEPVSPLFGSMPNTKEGIELQAILEYKGQTTHLFYIPKEMQEILLHDTGSGTIAQVCKQEICSPVNFGSDENWTRYTLAQANTFGYGRLAFNPHCSINEVMEEWSRLTFGNDPDTVDAIREMLTISNDIYASYTSPYGIGYMSDKGAHFNPEPEIRPVYNGCSKDGLGYNRSLSGSRLITQYCDRICNMYNNLETIPDDKLLWVHHLPFDYKLRSGVSLIQGMYNSYFKGCGDVDKLISLWERIEDKIDEKRYCEVYKRLLSQKEEAQKWKNNCLTYFSTLSDAKDEHGRALVPMSLSITAQDEGGYIFVECSCPEAVIYLVADNYGFVPRYTISSRLELAADGIYAVKVENGKAQKPMYAGALDAVVIDKNGFISRHKLCL